jgi:ABC-2 type transport system permease protein
VKRLRGTVRGLAPALYCEFLKARRSKVPLFTALGFALMPLAGGFFMIILKDPERFRRLGIITTKAQLTAGTADWPAYFRLLSEATFAGGAFLFAIITAWVFGREAADRTEKDLLAVPTPRGSIVAAKFVLIAVWGAALALLVLALGLGVGSAVGLPGYSSALAISWTLKAADAVVLTLALTPVLAFAASAGRGYLPPIAVTLLTLFFAQLVAATGWGAYFPWSIPALASGAAQGAHPVGASYAIVALTWAAGTSATFLWWYRADHTR